MKSASPPLEERKEEQQQTTKARRKTKAHRTTTAPDRYVRAAAGRARASGLPFSPRPLSRALLIVLRPTTSLRTKAKSVEWTPSGGRASWVLLRVQCCPRPYRPENALSIKSVREHFQVGRAARRWQVPVGVRWQRLQCRVAAFYFHRVSLPVQFWRACGCPPQFRPRLPWWQPLFWRWLVLSGWVRR